jgi:hypothetical protein
MRNMRDIIKLIEAASASGFNADWVLDELIQEMRQAEIVHSEEYVDQYNDALSDGLIEGPELDAYMDEPWSVPEFKQFLRRCVVKKYEELYTTTPIRAWRAIVAFSDWKPSDDRHIGIHWTMTRTLAIPYDADEGDHTFVIEAMIPPTSIHWEATVLHHMTRDVEEDEITLEPNAPVHIVAVKRRKGTSGY